MMDLLSKYIDFEGSEIVNTTTMPMNMSVDKGNARISPNKPRFSLVSEFGLQALTVGYTWQRHFSLGVFSCHK